MLRTQVQLKEAQVRELRKMAEREHISLAEAVRRCIDLAVAAAPAAEVAERYARAATVVGKYKDRKGASEVAERHDAYLAETWR